MSLPNRKLKTARTFKIPSADNCKYEHVPKEHQSRSLSTCSPESTNKKPPSSDFDNIQLDNIPLSLTLLCVTDPPPQLLTQLCIKTVLWNINT